MANGRMWLVHRPTGKKVLIGKRMASGWYLFHEGPALAAQVGALFADAQHAWSEEELDAFELVIES